MAIMGGSRSLWRPIRHNSVAWHPMQEDGPSHLRTFKVSQPWWVTEWQASTWWKKTHQNWLNSLDADPECEDSPIFFGSQRFYSFARWVLFQSFLFLNRGQPSSKGLCTLRLTWVVWNNGVGKGVEPPLLRQRQIPRMELRWEAENMRTFKTFGKNIFG